MIADRELAVLDILLSLAIIGGFGTALWVHTMSPIALYVVALPAFVFGVVWLVRAIGRLR